MRVLLIALVANVLIGATTIAQTIQPGKRPTRNIRFGTIGRDSINLALNHQFYLIEDSCSLVTRYGHVNMMNRKFFGKIKDVSKVNTQIILTEGNYTADGLKDGYFITHYLNGTLEAKGNFKNNQYDGNWEIYYADGKPMMTFTANGNDVKIIDVWDAEGKKTVNSGNGNYRVDLEGLYWRGKLVNGKPDGTWKAANPEDATNITLVSESYKDGQFKKGKNALGDYTDAPRLALVPPNKLPFTNAEKFMIALVGCDGVSLAGKRIVNAQYSAGMSNFTDNIVRLVGPYLQTVDLKPYENTLIINGEVSETGRVTNLRADNAFNSEISRGIIRELYSLPFLQPATIDGKPTTQKFNITFNFTRGSYRFTYSFLPINPN
ncbi:MAG: hypothetical protein EOP47_00360 [Sphingobacteriaceae bacterium]|nr:MAG: hypothetical protein EOP47_00360 [Sphingobacteriaceae bacterium]